MTAQQPAGAPLPARAPRRTAETAPFWDAAADHRLVLPRCDACSEWIWYPRRFCPWCGGREVSWHQVSGRGTVYSCTVIRQGQGPYADSAPYVLAYVELAEGPRVITNVVGCEPADVVPGMPVTVVWHDAPDGGALYRFAPSA